MANKVNGVEEWIRAPPPPGTCFSRFVNAIYNHEERSFLGRTPKRWGMFKFNFLTYNLIHLTTQMFGLQKYLVCSGVSF